MTRSILPPFPTTQPEAERQGFNLEDQPTVAVGEKRLLELIEQDPTRVLAEELECLTAPQLVICGLSKREI